MESQQSSYCPVAIIHAHHGSLLAWPGPTLPTPQSTPDLCSWKGSPLSASPGLVFTRFPPKAFNEIVEREPRGVKAKSRGRWERLPFLVWIWE